MIKQNSFYTFFVLIVLVLFVACIVSETNQNSIVQGDYIYSINHTWFGERVDTLNISYSDGYFWLKGIDEIEGVINFIDRDMYLDGQLLFPHNAKPGQSWQKNKDVYITYSGDVEINDIKTKSLLCNFNRFLFELNISHKYGIIRYSNQLVLIELERIINGSTPNN